MGFVLHQYVINFCKLLYTYYNTRGHSVRICVPFAKTSTLNYSFCNRIIPFWNTLPDSKVTSNVISTFKYKLKSIDFSKWLLDQF